MSLTSQRHTEKLPELADLLSTDRSISCVACASQMFFSFIPGFTHSFQVGPLLTLSMLLPKQPGSAHARAAPLTPSLGWAPHRL